MTAHCTNVLLADDYTQALRAIITETAERAHKLIAKTLGAYEQA